MGYYIDLEAGEFVILAERQADALAAGKAMATPGETWSWLTNEEILAARTLPELFRVWRYFPEIDEATGDIVGISHDTQKMGDEDQFFAVLAPFVQAGSWLHMSGEDGSHWRWYFDGDQMTTQEGRIVFDVPTPTTQEA